MVVPSLRVCRGSCCRVPWRPGPGPVVPEGTRPLSPPRIVGPNTESVGDWTDGQRCKGGPLHQPSPARPRTLTSRTRSSDLASDTPLRLTRRDRRTLFPPAVRGCDPRILHRRPTGTDVGPTLRTSLSHLSPRGNFGVQGVPGYVYEGQVQSKW